MSLESYEMLVAENKRLKEANRCLKDRDLQRELADMTTCNQLWKEKVAELEAKCFFLTPRDPYMEAVLLQPWTGITDEELRSLDVTRAQERNKLIKSLSQ